MRNKTGLGFSVGPRWAPYLFLIPFVVPFLVFLVFPLFSSIPLSMQQSFGPKHTEFVFLDNFKNLLKDPVFWIAVKNTVVYTLAAVFIQLPLSLGLAVALNHPRIKGRSFLRLIYFSPSLVGVVFCAMLFQLIFESRTGMLNVLLWKTIGFDPEFPWLTEYIMPALVIASLWMYVGFNMIYFLAALQNVSQDLVEAAEIDGASAMQRFWHITIPAIRPVFGFVTLLSIIGSLQLFELPFVMLGWAGPENRGLTMVMYLYQNGFETGDLGYASAVGWLLALALMGIAIVQRKIMKKYED